MPHIVLEGVLNSSQLEVVGGRLINRDYIDRRPPWVGGQISHHDSIFLSGLVQTLRPSKCVEIGVASGWSSSILLASLRRVREKDFHLFGVDLFENYYLDKSRLTGSVVDTLEPDLRNRFSLLTGRYAFEAMSDVGKIDFAFIDAHHMHPWASLDLISVLPFLDQESWVALHDLNLCRLERHKHKNRGPFYLYYLWPDSKINSTQEPTMIGAIQLCVKPAEYMPLILEILCTPWEVKIDNGVIEGLASFIEVHFGDEVRQKFVQICDGANGRSSG